MYFAPCGHGSERIGVRGWVWEDEWVGGYGVFTLLMHVLDNAFLCWIYIENQKTYLQLNNKKQNKGKTTFKVETAQLKRV